jgi:hypothetical protein
VYLCSCIHSCSLSPSLGDTLSYLSSSLFSTFIPLIHSHGCTLSLSS